MDTPVLLIIFNRPDTTRQVFEAIRKAKPKKLFVASDGPRPDKQGEKEKCEECRKIATAIDWECDLFKLFRDQNLGCGEGVSSAVTWFFEHVEEGIILEDDCLPSDTFFEYCGNMLKWYRNDERIFHINGTNVLLNRQSKGNYFLSKYTCAWGWASWRRSWLHYDRKMRSWPTFSLTQEFLNWCDNEEERKYWTAVFSKAYKGEIDTWDYQWLFTCITRKGLSIVPSKNLVTNLGFNENATHTFDTTNTHSALPHYRLQVEFDPVKITRDEKADKMIFATFGKKKKDIRQMIKNSPFYLRIRKSVKGWIQRRRKKKEDQIFYRNLGISNAELLRLNNLPFFYETSTALLGKKFDITSPYWYHFGIREIFHDNQYRFQPKSSEPYIIDCGANTGLSILYFFREYPGARILAFEPDPVIFEKLRSNCTRYGIDNLKLEQKAVWTSGETLTFKSDNGVSGQVTKQKEDGVAVNAIRLYDYLNEKIDFLKLDIEGAEIDVLADCSDRLMNVENLFVEYHSPKDQPQQLDRLLSILKQNHFRYYLKEAWVTKTKPFLEKAPPSYFDMQVNIFATREV